MGTNAIGLEKVMANEALSEEQRINKIKTTVLKQFSENRTENGRAVVYEVSDEIYYYNREGTWQISTLSTDDGGDVSAVLNQPLWKIEKAPLVPQPFDLLPEALIFADDAYCVTRQLAALLNLCEGKVADEFDEIAGDWRSVGITANQVLAYAQIHGLRCIVFFSEQAHCSVQAFYRQP